MVGIDVIAAERERQLREEGWQEEGDDDHDGDQLALAAATYAIPEECRDYAAALDGSLLAVPFPWPWDTEWWKPTPEDRVRELAKAGALIAAEIDRLQRLPAAPLDNGPT